MLYVDNFIAKFMLKMHSTKREKKKIVSELSEMYHNIEEVQQFCRIDYDLHAKYFKIANCQNALKCNAAYINCEKNNKKY